MSSIPCSQNPELRQRILEYTEVLKTQAHTLGDHSLSELDFYQGGVFRGAIERIRGQFSATMREKRDFVSRILSHLQDQGYVSEWDSAGNRNRHDYFIKMSSGKQSCIELKGCLDGNNTNIFERPAHAEEFVIWSVCTNPAADPRHNVWSGIHARLSAEIIENKKLVDGLIVWDWLCGTIGRPCPKLQRFDQERTDIGPFSLPPPCIYLFPKTVPSVRNNPRPPSNSINDVEILKALNECFGGHPSEINTVRFTVAHEGAETVRSSEISRDGISQMASDPTPIRRT